MFEKILKYTLIIYVIYKVIYLLERISIEAGRNADTINKLYELFQRSRFFR
jgi:hypothetical protein